MVHFCIELNKLDSNYEQTINMLTFIAEQLNCLHVITKPEYLDNTRKFQCISSTPEESFQFLSNPPIPLSKL